ncbi:MAG: hypothetical protein JWL63_3192 [Rhodocyclales bacterium]|nr:hypothetical protein [Rhodocyclales bacterium]
MRALKWLAWAFFGNDDDGPIGDVSFNPGRIDTWSFRRAWWLRNPAHNWTFYVIGVAGKTFSRSGIAPKDVFNPAMGFNVCITRYKAWSSAAHYAAGALVALILLAPVELLVWIFGWWALLALPLVPFMVVPAFRVAGWMPFISYQSARVKTYFGWRDRGNFGIKLTKG